MVNGNYYYITKDGYIVFACFDLTPHSVEHLVHHINECAYKLWIEGILRHKIMHHIPLAGIYKHRIVVYAQMPHGRMKELKRRLNILELEGSITDSISRLKSF